MTLPALEALETQLEQTTRPDPRPYSTRAWGELVAMDLPPVEYFWGSTFAAGQMQAIYGQGGLGKSRVSLNLARNQVLGLPFAGMDTGTRPLRHLLMGSENSIYRLQYDTQRQSRNLTPGEMEALSRHIRMATLEAPDDAFISLADPANVQRWIDTVEAFGPDVLWVDPFGDVRPGDANSDADTRWTITELLRIARKHNAGAGLVILSHARTGAKNILQAVGYDGANFGKDSKALYSCARAVINMAPGDETENPPLLLANSKNNNGPRFDPFAVRLDPETMLYSRDDEFDVQEWISDVQSAANGKRGGIRRRLSEDAAFDVLGDDTGTATEVRQKLRDAGATRDEADDLCKRLVTAGRWERWRPQLQHTAIFIGPPSAMDKRKRETAEQMQRRLNV